MYKGQRSSSSRALARALSSKTNAKLAYAAPTESRTADNPGARTSRTGFVHGLCTLAGELPPNGWQDLNVAYRRGVSGVGSVWVDYRRILLSWVGIVTGAGTLLFLVGVGAERRARASND